MHRSKQKFLVPEPLHPATTLLGNHCIMKHMLHYTTLHSATPPLFPRPYLHLLLYFFHFFSQTRSWNFWLSHPLHPATARGCPLFYPSPGESWTRERGLAFMFDAVCIKNGIQVAIPPQYMWHPFQATRSTYDESCGNTNEF